VANDLTNTVVTTYRTFIRESARHASWQRLTAMRVMDPSLYQYQDAEVYGLTLFSAVSGSPTVRDLKSEKYATNVIDIEEIVSVSVPDLKRNPGVLVKAGAQLANLFWATIASAFWTTVKAAASTAHPYASTTVMNSEAVKVVDSFTLNPPNVAGTFSQTNAYALGFGSDSIDTMVEARGFYRDISGNYLERNDEDKPILIPPQGKLQAAKSIYKRDAELYTGSGIENAGYDETLAGIVPISGSAGSDSWGLWWQTREVDLAGNGSVKRGPIYPVLFYGPEITVEPADNAHTIYLKAIGGYAIGISGSCHTDLQWSTP